ncbi:MAG: hypothetical protein ACK5X3_03900 [Pseudomonadota bacterium]
MSESFGRGESALFLQNPELAAAARRQRLAQGLLEQAVKPRNVGGHAGGLAQMGQALIAGYMSHREDERIRGIADAQRAREEEEVRALMGGGMPAAAPGAQAPATESALATPPGSLPPPIPLGAEAPPMAQALMNPPGQPGQPGQGGAAPGMPMPPPVPAGGAAQPGGLPSMDQIMAGMASRSPRVQAVAQMLFQQAQRQEDLALRAQERDEERRFRERQLAAGSSAGRERFSAPTEMLDENGQRVTVMIGDRGTLRLVQGYSAPPPNTGLVPQVGYRQGANGEPIPVPLLPNNRGELVEARLPQDVQYGPRTREINLGTEIVTVDGAGNVVARRPIDIRGRETEEKIGQSQGAEIAGAPTAFRTAADTLKNIDDVLNHPAFGVATGVSGMIARNVPGTPAFDFGQRFDQLTGRAFLQAFETLKGGGQITEIEGKKATDAIARLNPRASAEDTRQALQELREVVVSAQQRASMRGGAASPGNAPAAPSRQISPPSGFRIVQ